MIKIELDHKKNMEETFLEDLFTVDSNDLRKGKFFTALDNQDNKDLLKRKYKKLYKYFYNQDGEVNTDKARGLLLMNRAAMEELIDEFGGYDCRDPKQRKRSDQLLKKIFQYDKFSKRQAAYKLSKAIGVTVCPYCNRLYTMTLEKEKVRPQFDHYFPKSRYPYLALSLYNLIPSCSVCNMAKSDMDTKETPILYPYEEEFGEKVVFGIDIKNKDEFAKCIIGNSENFEVSIKNPTHFLEQQISKQDSSLHITQLYNEHKDYVRDIMKNYHINTVERIDELLRCFPSLFSTKDEVLSITFMSGFSKKEWGKRPLAKLTHDIYMELTNKGIRADAK